MSGSSRSSAVDRGPIPRARHAGSSIRHQAPGLLRRAGIAEGPSGADGPVAVAPPIVHDVLSEPGRPLEPATRARMGDYLGTDLGRVRVHTGPKAAESARVVDARAYAVGDRVVFGAGSYAPGTPAGDRLLAHELTHTVQQSAAVRREPAGLAIGRADDPAEREARASANAFAAGSPRGPARVARRTSAVVAREATDDADAKESLGALDSFVADEVGEELVGRTSWTVLKEFLRGLMGGLRTVPPEQQQRIDKKFDDFGYRDAAKYAGGYALGILEGLWISIKGLAEAVFTLFKLPFEIMGFLTVKLPELAARYGPRIARFLTEGGGLPERINKVIKGFLKDPAKGLEQIQSFLDAAGELALSKVRSLGRGVAGKVLGLLEEPWFEFGLDVGKVVGQVLFEIILAVASEGIATVVKEAVTVAGRIAARLVAGAVELIKTAGRLLGEALEWVGRIGRRAAGELGELFEGARALLQKLQALFAELAGESALAETGAGGVRVPVPDAGPAALESRALKPPPRTSPAKVSDLTPPKVHPSNVPKDAPAPRRTPAGRREPFADDPEFQKGIESEFKSKAVEPSPPKPPPTSSEIRALSGRATGGGNLKDFHGRFFAEVTQEEVEATAKATGTAAKNARVTRPPQPIPGQIARGLRRRGQFKNFAEFRQTFWKLVAEDPELSQGWGPSNLARMREGEAPFVSRPLATGRGVNTKVQLNHKVRIVDDPAGLYDLDNIEVVTPTGHEVLGRFE